MYLLTAHMISMFFPGANLPPDTNFNDNNAAGNNIRETNERD